MNKVVPCEGGRGCLLLVGGMTHFCHLFVKIRVTF